MGTRSPGREGKLGGEQSNEELEIRGGASPGEAVFARSTYGLREAEAEGLGLYRDQLPQPPLREFPLGNGKFHFGGHWRHRILLVDLRSSGF